MRITGLDGFFIFPSGSVYEPLKSINLPRPDETLWDKLDHYYRIGKLNLGKASL